MTPNPLHAELSRRVRPFIEAYHDDLDKHDLNWLNKNPGVPFLHFTRAYGTHLNPLHAADDPRWPAPGVLVPYLFSHASREQILQSNLGGIRYCASQPHHCILYHDGLILGTKWEANQGKPLFSLREITPAEAIRIGETHLQMVEAAWGVATAAWPRVARNPPHIPQSKATATWPCAIAA
jgi:hypothetical protein